MKNQHIISTINGIQALANKKANIQFSYGLKKNEKLLNHELEIIRESLPKEPEGYHDHLKKVQEIVDSVNANKNIQSDYKQAEFEKLQKAYHLENEALVEEIETYEKSMEEINNMDYSGKLHKIKFENLPNDLSKVELDNIEFIVEFPDDWDELEDDVEREGEK